MFDRQKVLATVALAAALAAALALPACGPGVETYATQAPGQAVIAESAGVRLAMLPAGFEVVANDAAGLRLATEPTGSVEITLGEPVPGGLNIVETVKSELAAFEQLPEGQSFGQNQLIAPIGLTYVARGRYVESGATTEELRALTVHPWGNRLLTVAYSYPLGEDTTERAGQLMELLGEIEPLEEPQAEASLDGP